MHGEIFNYHDCPMNHDLTVNITFCDNSKILYPDLFNKFRLTSTCTGLLDLNVEFSDSLNTLYYPVLIKEVDLSGDSIYIGCIPLVADTFGYWTEWGTNNKSGIFKRQSYFQSTVASDIPGRLNHEQDYNDLFRSQTHKTDTIFQNIIVNFVNTRKHKSYQETRYLTIYHQDLLRISHDLITHVR